MNKKIIGSSKPHKIRLDDQQKLAARPRTQRVAEPRLNPDQDRMIEIPPHLARQNRRAQDEAAEPNPLLSAKSNPQTVLTPSQTVQNDAPLMSAELVRRISSLKESNQQLRRQTDMLSRALPREPDEAPFVLRRQPSRTPS